MNNDFDLLYKLNFYLETKPILRNQLIEYLNDPTVSLNARLDAYLKYSKDFLPIYKYIPRMEIFNSNFITNVFNWYERHKTFYFNDILENIYERITEYSYLDFAASPLSEDVELNGFSFQLSELIEEIITSGYSGYIHDW